jgi:inorganic pyrophosphatase
MDHLTTRPSRTRLLVEAIVKRDVRRGDVTTLNPWATDGVGVTVVIETPKGSRNKYAFNPALGVFELKRVLPAGMGFPYDFGFVPSTLADDGDPLDVLVLMDEPAFAGCVLTCRLVGIVEGEQIEKKRKERNDRIVAIEQDNHSFASVKVIRDLGKPFVRELEQFFVNYHELSGQTYRILGAHGPRAARAAVKDAIRLARRKRR